MRKTIPMWVAIILIATMVLSACTPAATPTTAPAPTTAAEQPTTAPAEPTSAPVEAPTTAPVEAPTAASPADTLPRNETLYFNGQQWSAVVGWNPYSSNCNNAMAIAQKDNARVIMFETPYLYNMLDGKQYPLLADGPCAWNADMTEITFKIKKAANWSDGTPVTADDVAYTWASQCQVPNRSRRCNYRITSIPSQLLIHRRLWSRPNWMRTAKPSILCWFLLTSATTMSSRKPGPKHWKSAPVAMPAKFMADTAEDVVYSGPYHKFFADDTKVVFVRDDNYWGQDASMWGKLPVPKYLAHMIFKDNAAGTTALQAGEVDVSQQFNSNVQDLWLKQNLPISTYLPEAPYGIGASLPTAFFNLSFLWFGPGCGPQGDCHGG